MLHALVLCPRDRLTDVLRFVTDTRVWPTSDTRSRHGLNVYPSAGVAHFLAPGRRLPGLQIGGIEEQLS